MTDPFLQEDRTRLFTVVRDGRMRGKGHKLKQERLRLNIRRKLFHNEIDQAVEQVAQRGCAISVFGCFQDLTG